MVAPLLILLVFGMIEFGRMVMVQQVLVNAVREGARVAVLEGATSTTVTTAVNNCLTNASLPTAVITMTPSNPASALVGDPITVTASLTYGQVSWLTNPLYISKTKTLNAKCVMRREASS